MEQFIHKKQIQKRTYEPDMKRLLFLFFKILAGLFSSFVIFLTLLDLIHVFTDSSGYYFGAEFYPWYSIHASKEIYVLFSVFSLFLFAITLLFLLKRTQTRKWGTTFILALLIAAYPIITIYF